MESSPQPDQARTLEDQELNLSEPEEANEEGGARKGGVTNLKKMLKNLRKNTQKSNSSEKVVMATGTEIGSMEAVGASSIQVVVITTVARMTNARKSTLPS